VRVRRAEASLGVRDGPPIEIAPLFGLRLRTERLELRLPSQEELVALAQVAEGGVHRPEQMPFRVAWTDGAGQPGFVESMVEYHLGLQREWTKERWSLDLSVWADGAPIGFQSMRAEGFPETRRVETGSWLGQRFQGRGYGTEMRVAMLDLAFLGLGALVAESGYAEDNLQSKGVSVKLGYKPAGEGWESPRGQPIRHLKLAVTAARWREIAHAPTRIDGLDGCLALFGAAG
jgi:RimJ/RimL family protein N-acetyltransferase